jgi:hypothetical protein
MTRAELPPLASLPRKQAIKKSPISFYDSLNNKAEEIQKEPAIK